MFIAEGIWKAYIERDFNSWGGLTLHLTHRSIDNRLSVVVGTDLVIQTIEEGTTLADNGIRLSSGALEAIGAAIGEWSGLPQTNEAAENKVLREALAVERTRVDRVLFPL
jgi:hypothetical protein